MYICIFQSVREFSIDQSMVYADSQFIKRKIRFIHYIYWDFTSSCFISRKISNIFLYPFFNGKFK